MAQALRLRCWKGEWQVNKIFIRWVAKSPDWLSARYVVDGSGDPVYDALSDDVKSKLALLQVSPKNTHIEGIGFRSDYEGEDIYIEPFFYVVV